MSEQETVSVERVYAWQCPECGYDNTLLKEPRVGSRKSCTGCGNKYTVDQVIVHKRRVRRPRP